jgi:hypothetical protein
MVESNIVLLYIRSLVWGIIYAVGPSVATVQTLGGLYLVMVAEDPRHSHQ